MSMNVEQILESVSNMSVMEVVELVKAMEEKFGVSAQAAVAIAAAPAAAAEAAEEKTSFKVVMKAFGDNKINVIREIRTITGLDLKAAKDLVEGVPSTVKDGVAKDEAEKIKKQLEGAGAQVVLE